MSKPIRSHFTLIEAACAKYPDAPAFRVPVPGTSDKLAEWKAISYKKFSGDILTQASFWGLILRQHGAEKGSVVSVWIEGMSYADVTLTYGLSRAGYTVELISLSIPSPEAVFDLIRLANSKFLICDSSKRSPIQDTETQSKCPVPVHWYSSSDHYYRNIAAGVKPDQEMPKTVEELVKDPKGIAFILHTSGSTSGRPKLVPWSWEWLDMTIESLPGFHELSKGAVSWIGNACHAGQNLSMINVFFHCLSVVQPTRLDFSSDELKDMVKRCNLRMLLQFPSYFAAHVKRARTDPELLQILRDLEGIYLGGMALTEDDLAWCVHKGLPLVLAFGSTEYGLLLKSKPVTIPPVYEVNVEPEALAFMSIHDDTANDQDTSENEEDLKELIVLGTSKRCPASSLTAQDGNFHTGDLFVEVGPGKYESRGRGDDWIKLANAGRCDTRAIEANVLHTCPDIVHACVIIGSLRPEIVLVVEYIPSISSTPQLSPEDEDKIKTDILQRLAPVQAKMWGYEKVLHKRQIRVVEKGSLPRTGSKGNIRRKEVERAYKSELDRVYVEGFRA